MVEVLVASAIILIVFVIASTSLNNIFFVSIKNSDTEFQTRVKEIHYLSLHNQLVIPYYEDTPLWDITIEKKDQQLKIRALNKKNNTSTTVIWND